MIPVEAFAPAATVAVAIITALGALLVRERRRNGNPGNPGNPGGSISCPYANGRMRVTPSEETMGILRGLKDEVGNLRTAINNQASALAVLVDRPRGKGEA